MAVFLVNSCKFGRCGATFPTLRELIQHIEETHIDFDPHIVEKFESQQPSSLPLSYVIRVFKESSRKNDCAKKMRTHSPASSICSNGNTPTGSEMDDDFLSDSDDSCDSWTSKEEFSSEFILRMLSATDGNEGKPFACPVPGCKKRYKNVSGIKYHTKNGHSKESKPVKCFKCHCGKSYKTPQGLKTHMATLHCQGLLNKPKGYTIDSVLGAALASSNSSPTYVHNLSSAQKSLPQSGMGNSQSSKLNMFSEETKLGSSMTFSENFMPSTLIEHKSNDNIKPPPLSPILQQHLLSPVTPKKPSIQSVAKHDIASILNDHQYP